MSVIPVCREGLDPYGTMRKSAEGRRVARKKDWVEGWWENIDKEPIYIKDKEQLKAECQKRGVIPKAFAKPVSQGKGLEWTF
jgi:hypothetical protein